MPVDSIHPKYQQAAPVVERCRAASEGEGAIKAGGTKYLPKLSDHTGGTDKAYLAYVERGMFYAAAGRTVQGLSGLACRKPLRFDGIPARFSEDAKRIGIHNQSLEALRSKIKDEVLSTGRVGILLDASEEENAEPYLVLYKTEDIINWREEMIGDRLEPTLVVLREDRFEENEADTFELEKVERVRVLELGFSAAFERQEKGEGEPPEIVFREGMSEKDIEVPFYSHQIFRKEEDDDDGEERWVPEGPPVIPRMFGGRLLPYIPFRCASHREIKMAPEDPPILALVDVNISHWRNSADLEHGRHYCALPTPWRAGFDTKKGEPVPIGPRYAWDAENPQAKAGMLEFTGAGLGHIREGMTDKEALMATLGARLLETAKVGVESGEALSIRKASDHSVLVQVATNVADLLGQMASMFIYWVRPSTERPEVTATADTDFTPTQMDPQMFLALMAALQAGSMSYEAFYWNIQRGELVEPGKTIEQEIEAIGLGAPMSPLEGDTDDLEEPDDEPADEPEEEEEDEEGDDS